MSISSKLSRIDVNFTLKDHTYEVLRAAILDMNIYQEGVDLRLDERQMAEQLGISRTPIREALARLAQDGLVEIQPRKGVFVVRKSLEEILEMVVTWAALESMAARLAADHASDRDLRDLRKFAMKHSADAARANLAEYSEANIQFHQRILELSGCSLSEDDGGRAFRAYACGPASRHGRERSRQPFGRRPYGDHRSAGGARQPISPSASCANTP